MLPSSLFRRFIVVILCGRSKASVGVVTVEVVVAADEGDTEPFSCFTSVLTIGSGLINFRMFRLLSASESLDVPGSTVDSATAAAAAAAAAATAGPLCMTLPEVGVAWSLCSTTTDDASLLTEIRRISEDF